jgi:hypothetical protein
VDYIHLLQDSPLAGFAKTERAFWYHEFLDQVSDDHLLKKDSMESVVIYLLLITSTDIDSHLHRKMNERYNIAVNMLEGLFTATEVVAGIT